MADRAQPQHPHDFPVFVPVLHVACQDFVYICFLRCDASKPEASHHLSLSKIQYPTFLSFAVSVTSLASKPSVAVRLVVTGGCMG